MKTIKELKDGDRAVTVGVIRRIGINLSTNCKYVIIYHECDETELAVLLVRRGDRKDPAPELVLGDVFIAYGLYTDFEGNRVLTTDDWDIVKDWGEERWIYWRSLPEINIFKKENR